MAGEIKMGTSPQVSKIFLSLFNNIKNGFSHVAKQYPGFIPVVNVIQNTSDCSISSVFSSYIAPECGIKVHCIAIPANSDNNFIKNLISKCNVDPNIQGVLLELTDDLDCDFFYDAVLPSKDVGGVNHVNINNINKKHCGDVILPCTASALFELSKEFPLKDSKVLLCGKQNFVHPIVQLLLHENAAVTVARSETENISLKVKDADIVISATNTSSAWKEFLKPNGLFIDCSVSSEKGDIEKIQGKYISKNDFQNLTALMIAQNLLVSSKSLLAGKWNLSSRPINFGPPGLSDIEIARSQTLKDISVLASEIGLLPHEIELYGDKKAKVHLSVLERCKYRCPGKYVVVAGITPTPLGEGKSTTTVGLAQALGVHLKRNVIACLRQPSQGPTFGIKGGAAGGGYSQVVPMEDFNLHLTGDIHAVTAANNLLAAQIDARMFHEATQSDEDLFKRLIKVTKGKKEFSKIQLARLQKLGIDKTDPDDLTADERRRFARLNIDPTTVTWHRVLDTNDRFLRKIMVGMAATEKKMTRETQFDIAVASEIMAILALTSDMADMKTKLGKIVIGNDTEKNPVTADDLGVTGALAVLLKDAIRPNLMQTLEGTPVLVHAGPFANIAHGNSSIIADKLALKIVGEGGFVVTESGFGADIGFEKFCDIKCRYSGLEPDCVVIVATIRALKLHGGGPNIPAGALPKAYSEENIELVEKGFCNLKKHIQIASTFGLPVIVALNRFGSDTDAELNLVKELSNKSGAFRCVICSHFSEGGKGAKELAEAVIAATEQSSKFQFLYDLNLSIVDKITIIAKQYGADGIQLTPQAEEMINLFESQGFGKLPICMAKTPLSLTDNPAKKGAPENFILPITDVKLSAGAGFVYPLVGAIMTMPGLSTRPCFYDIDIDPDTGNIEGLF
ncbi:uncharacterized protein LOC129227821 [Uloborus diversus]|uniref:uncharacterized protein LOC129227821 n=1 Tax=Uloborus diversus TaxID=327109 RepID=UPI00240A5B1E|nr:uncharacterized protein LOC129227821 [Uloborus diversus]